MTFLASFFYLLTVTMLALQILHVRIEVANLRSDVKRLERKAAER